MTLCLYVCVYTDDGASDNMELLYRVFNSTQYVP